MFYHYQIGSSSKGREAREEEPGPLLLTVVTAGVAVAGLGVGQGGAQDWADLQACSEGGQGEPLSLLSRSLLETVSRGQGRQGTGGLLLPLHLLLLVLLLPPPPLASLQD